MNREKFPLADFKLARPYEATTEQETQYEIAYQLARIGDILERMAEALPMAGKGF